MRRGVGGLAALRGWSPPLVRDGEREQCCGGEERGGAAEGGVLVLVAAAGCCDCRVLSSLQAVGGAPLLLGAGWDELCTATGVWWFTGGVVQEAEAWVSAADGEGGGYRQAAGCAGWDEVCTVEGFLLPRGKEKGCGSGQR